MMADDFELLAQIEALKAQLATAQAEQWRLIRLVCHELRLPLSSIKGYNDLMLLMGQLGDQQKDFVLRIKKNVGRMSGMITNLHELAFMGEGRFTLKPASIAPADAIEKVCQEQQALAAERGNALTVTLPGGLAAVLADHERFEQIIRIMVENALMYTPTGGQVTVSAHATDDSSVQVTVADTGIGVAEADRKSLFTLFFRGDVPLVREQAGAGMNLYMLRCFVEHMGGAYGVEFPAAGGAQFWVRLPSAH
jgi:signal transduction histidine kinase